MTTDVLKKNLVENNRHLFVLAGLLVIGTALLSYWVVNDQGRLGIATALIIMLAGMAYARPEWAILGSLVYVTFIGDFRRWLIGFTSWSGQDPLLMVVPIVTVLLLAGPLLQKQIKVDTPLAKWIIVLMAIMAIQIFNPVQGGLSVGIGGALFYLVPLMWFWVGRTYLTPQFLYGLLFYLILPIAIIAALFGLYQTFYGLPAYQQAWMDVAGHVAMYVRGTPRGFSFFPSSIEHCLYIGIAAVALWAAFLKGWRLAFLPIPLIIVAIFLVGSRGPFVALLVTMILMWAVLGKNVSVWVPRLAIAIFLGGIGLYWSLNQVAQTDVSEQISGFVDHQTTGLLNPLDEEQSTAVGHTTMKIAGFKKGLERPLGAGLGSTTLAGIRFGSSGGSTEMDVSDMFVSLGLIGGLVYVVIVILVGLTAVRYWTTYRTVVALAAIGILFMTFSGWLFGGRYAVSAIVWLVIGAIDRFQRDELA